MILFFKEQIFLLVLARSQIYILSVKPEEAAMKSKFFLLVLFFSILYFNTCDKKGVSPVANIPPETSILSYVISQIPENDSLGNPTSKYKVTVYWKGVDSDGQIKEFHYSTDSSNFEITTAAQHDFIFKFSVSSDIYSVWVKAVDNLNAQDPTPAKVSIKREAGLIETQLIDGPPNGAEVSPGVRFKILSTPGNGFIKDISYRIDDASWIDVEADTIGMATIDIVGLDYGERILYFAGKRDDGERDKTPIVLSLIVRDGFKPVIINTSPVVDGQGWYPNLPLTFSWETDINYYYGVLPNEPYSFSLNDDSNFDTNPESPLSSGWVSDTTHKIIPQSGYHTFYIKAKDIGNSVDTMKIRFVVAGFGPPNGILVVNGVDPSIYGTELQTKIDSNAYWGDFYIHFWDIFGTMASSLLMLPQNVDYAGGGFALSPDVMANYSTIVWLGSNLTEDLAAWKLTAVYEYLQWAGNFVLTTESSYQYFDQRLKNYLNISWFDSSSTFTIQDSKPVFPGLLDFTPFLLDMSKTSVFSVTGFMDETDDEIITNWDGISGFSKSDLKTTLLFAHRSSSFNQIYPFDKIRGLGVWSHPNFTFSSANASNEFPTPGTIEATGNFIFISGKHYRFNTQSCRNNFEFILKNLCGEM